MIEPGDFIIRSLDPHDGTKVEVLQADPVIWVSGLFIHEVPKYPCASIVDRFLHIKANNGHWIYRIGEYDALRDRYLCNWPD